MAKCKKCGAENIPENKFCCKCGARLSEEKSFKCSKCGAENSLENRFCCKCGAKFANYLVSATGEQIEKKKVERSKSNKKKTIALVVAITTVFITAGLIAGIYVLNNRPEKKIIGYWQLVERSDYGNFPEEDFYIYENGEVTTDGYNGNYYIYDSNNEISMTFWGQTFDYSFNMYSDTLSE